MGRCLNAARERPAVMENGDVGADELVMAYFLDEGVRLRNRYQDRFAQRVSGPGRFCISVTQGWQAQDRERVHSRNSLDVAISVLQRNLASVDERHGGGAEAESNLSH